MLYQQLNQKFDAKLNYLIAKLENRYIHKYVQK